MVVDVFVAVAVAGCILDPPPSATHLAVSTGKPWTKVSPYEETILDHGHGHDHDQ